MSQIDQTIEDLNIYYASGRHKIVILNPNNEKVKAIDVINMLGQSVYSIQQIFEGTYNEYDMQRLSVGTYIIKVVMSDNRQLTKKVTIN